VQPGIQHSAARQHIQAARMLLLQLLLEHPPAEARAQRNGNASRGEMCRRILTYAMQGRAALHVHLRWRSAACSPEEDLQHGCGEGEAREEAVKVLLIWQWHVPPARRLLRAPELAALSFHGLSHHQLQN
jgi:hypothetical protein